MQRKYTEGARIFITGFLFVVLLTTAAAIILFTGIAEPSRTGQRFEAFSPPITHYYIRCRYEEPVVTTDSKVLAQKLAGGTYWPVCIVRDRTGQWRVYSGEIRATEKPEPALTVPVARAEYKRIWLRPGIGTTRVHAEGSLALSSRKPVSFSSVSCS